MKEHEEQKKKMGLDDEEMATEIDRILIKRTYEGWGSLSKRENKILAYGHTSAGCAKCGCRTKARRDG